MTPIRLTMTAVALGAATFFVTALILDGAPPRAVDGPAPTAADDRAAFVARVAAGLENEPHARGRAPSAEARTAAPALPRSDAADIAAATRAALAAAGPVAATAAQVPATVAAVATVAPDAAAASGFRAPTGAVSPTFALGAEEDWMAAEAQGWVAASGSGPATLELRPMPRRR